MSRIGLVLAATLVTMTAEAARERPRPVAITVQDAAGAPIARARVVVYGEGDFHVVNEVTGRWEADTAYPQGTALPFTQGTKLVLFVGAPGYHAKMVELVVEKPRSEVTLSLPPVTVPELACATEAATAEEAVAATRAALEAATGEQDRGCLQAAHAWAAWQAWVEAEASVLSAPTQQAQALAYERHQRAQRTAREWLDWTVSAGADPKDARQLCTAAALDPTRCR